MIAASSESVTRNPSSSMVWRMCSCEMVSKYFEMSTSRDMAGMRPSRTLGSMSAPPPTGNISVAPMPLSRVAMAITVCRAVSIKTRIGRRSARTTSSHARSSSRGAWSCPSPGHSSGTTVMPSTSTSLPLFARRTVWYSSMASPLLTRVNESGISAWRSAGTSTEIGRPSISSAEYPNMPWAPRFQDVMTPSRPVLMTASTEDSTTEAKRRLASSACRRSVISTMELRNRPTIK